MPKLEKPPKAYDAFVTRFPELGTAWELTSRAGRRGPLDDTTRLLCKLALAVGAQRPGAAHSAARKALAAGVKREALEQVVALGASTLGFPATVAAWGWVLDEAGPARKRRPVAAGRRSR